LPVSASGPDGHVQIVDDLGAAWRAQLIAQGCDQRQGNPTGDRIVLRESRGRIAVGFRLLPDLATTLGRGRGQEETELLQQAQVARVWFTPRAL
jgi:hypothetical protein